MSAATPTENRRLKYAATINDESLTEATEPDYELQYIDIGNVDSYGHVHDVVAYKFEDAPSRARRIARHGDVIISTVRTYLQAIAPIENPPENLIVSTGFAVVRPESNLFDARFCKYAVREKHFLWEVESHSTGVSYPAINASDLADIRISLPALATQRLIADYLDRETSRIDALVAEKEKMLALLEEKRAAIISRAVTRGLNPDAPLKPSGLDWLGDIPAHWEVVKLKYIGEPVLGLTFNPDNLVNEGEGVLVLRASNVKNGKIVLEDNIYVDMEFPEKLRTRVDDIVICSRSGSRALIGKNALIDNWSSDLTFGAFMTVFRSQHNKFLYWVFNSTLFDYQAGAFGTSTINQLTTETLDNMEVPIPPEAEQKKISAYLTDTSKKFDEVISSTIDSIVLAKERRAALITAAVIGQIPAEEMLP